MCGATWSNGTSEHGASLAYTVVKESMERASIRILARRYERSKQKIMHMIHIVTAAAPTSAMIAKRLSPKWSGILVVDGKYVRVFDRLSMHLNHISLARGERRRCNRKVWLCGIDSGTGDLPHYALAEEETMIDLVLFFRQLKKIGYPLRILVCDGNQDIIRAARKVYGDALLHQLCTRHFIEGLKRKARDVGFGDDRSVMTCISEIQHIIEAKDLEEAGKRMSALQRRRFTNSCKRLLVKDFFTHANPLTTHLQYPTENIPHTSNEIENVFTQVRMRLSSIGRFGNWKSAEDYLKTWALSRRCTPFTDCRGARRYRNGKSPLHLACVKPVDIDFLSLLKTTRF